MMVKSVFVLEYAMSSRSRRNAFGIKGPRAPGAALLASLLIFFCKWNKSKFICSGWISIEVGSFLLYASLIVSSCSIISLMKIWNNEHLPSFLFQVRLIKELYGYQIGELYCSLPYHMVEFVLADFDCKVTVSLRYADLLSTLPSGISVLAWPIQQLKKLRTLNNRKEALGHQLIRARLAHAEDALRTMSLPEGRFLLFRYTTYWRDRYHWMCSCLATRGCKAEDWRRNCAV